MPRALIVEDRDGSHSLIALCRKSNSPIMPFDVCYVVCIRRQGRLQQHSLIDLRKRKSPYKAYAADTRGRFSFFRALWPLEKSLFTSSPVAKVGRRWIIRRLEDYIHTYLTCWAWQEPLWLYYSFLALCLFPECISDCTMTKPHLWSRQSRPTDPIGCSAFCFFVCFL